MMGSFKIKSGLLFGSADLDWGLVDRVGEKFILVGLQRFREATPNRDAEAKQGKWSLSEIGKSTVGSFKIKMGSLIE